MFSNFFITAWRHLRNNKLFSLINTGGLAIAMTVAIFMLLWVQNEWRFDRYHTDAENIHLLSVADKKNNNQLSELVPYPLQSVITQRLRGIERSTTAMSTRYQAPVFNINNRVFSETEGLWVDSNWFSLFNYDFIEGSASSFNSNPRSLILTESKAHQFFGNQPFLGKIVQVDSIGYAVAGVIRDNPAFSSFQQDVFIPLAAKLSTTEAIRDAAYWGSSSCITFIKLAPQTNAAQLAHTITNIYAENKVSDNAFTRQVELVPLPMLHFTEGLSSSIFPHGSRKSMYIFSSLAILLLITASINFVNLSVARAGLRSKEISMRKITGAGRWHLFAQLMTEAVLTALLSLALTMLLLYALWPLFRSFTTMSLELDLLNLNVVYILAGTLITVILLTGIYPALLLSSFKPVLLFQDRGVLGIRKGSLQTILVTTQFVLAVVMITGTVVVYRQLSFIQQQDAGYKREQVFSFRLPFKTIQQMKLNPGQKELFLTTFKNELTASSALQNVTRINFGSIQNNTGRTGQKFDWYGYPKDNEEKLITEFMTDTDFNKIMQLTFVEGGWFNGSDARDKDNIILNETAVRLYGLKSPVVGTRFSSPATEGIVAGVVKDFHFQSLHEAIAPLVIRQDQYALGNTFLIKTQPGQIQAALDIAEKAWKKYFSGDHLSFHFLDEEFELLYAKDRQMMRFSFLFGCLSILLSCIGLLGITVFAVRQRNKEISIRKVLGASSANISLLLSGKFLKPVIIALLIAIPISYIVADQWLQNYAYRISISWQYFISSAAIIILISLLTIAVQAISAGWQNPVKALRKE
ncbi:ABC transporter permease [Terrimonas sp. NA20]|uniref:ABC transporter permease n=1 Tax=Terrimonas ginsenosidimutans TaxID=2908004 RepID=A0ABS9L0K9_9BACT|nr:ABC transporter permease [Terrimonas ginsenosidimutans]MCG2618149.1 ABC transporter permease [Terrimonas ginsenosidimutans]